LLRTLASGGRRRKRVAKDVAWLCLGCAWHSADIAAHRYAQCCPNRPGRRVLGSRATASIVGLAVTFAVTAFFVWRIAKLKRAEPPIWSDAGRAPVNTVAA
jgi:hypothetical protein